MMARTRGVWPSAVYHNVASMEVGVSESDGIIVEAGPHSVGIFLAVA